MNFEIGCFYKYNGGPYVSRTLHKGMIYKCYGYSKETSFVYLIDDKHITYGIPVDENDNESFVKSGMNPDNWEKRNNAAKRNISFTKDWYTYEIQAPSPHDDKVNHPTHYTWLKDKCGIEVIDIVRHMDFDLGNAIKYILRCGHKSEQGYSNKDKMIEDLRKAIFYINDKINTL